MDFLEYNKAKGFFHQCSNEQGLSEKLKQQKISFYLGFDCTATSLHVGNLLQIMNVRNLQKYGHKPIILIGSGTSRIGDPSFKNEARPVLSDEQIEQNKQGIKRSLEKFISFGSGPTDAIMVDNYDWLSKINYLDFLKKFGSLISINRMLTFDIIRNKLDSELNLSFLEFNYMLLQGYDFVHLNKTYDCVLQLGGSDQWANIINGVELGRKSEGKELFALTTPLLTTASGQKMGKTMSGAVWLNEDKLSPYEYYQFWRNTEDDDAIKFLKIFTDLDLSEIDKLAHLKGQEINQVKKILAFEATKLCHGEEAAHKAEETANNVFEKGLFQGELKEFSIDGAKIESGQLSLVEALCLTNLASSKGAAKRLIEGGGAKLNNVKITDCQKIINMTDFSEGKIIIASGKKDFAIVKLEADNG